MSIRDEFKKINSRIDVLAYDKASVDIGLDGYLPKSEAGPAITGIVGGKGKLTVTDLNDVNYGGAYLVEAGKNYTNLPFNGISYQPAELVVEKIYGSNPHTENYAVKQAYYPLNLTYKNEFAWRTKLVDHWSEWHYSAGKTLFDGQAGMDIEVPLMGSPKNYNLIDFVWAPYAQPKRVDRFFADQKTYRMLNTSMPDPTGSSAGTISVFYEGLMAILSSDGMKMTFKYTNLLHTPDDLATYSKTAPTVFKIIGI